MGPLSPTPDPAGLSCLVRVALGSAPADTIIRGARLVNVFNEQVEEPGAVALALGRVASLGPELPGWLGQDTRVIEARGLFLIPGLIDAHTHLDSIFQLGPYGGLALARGPPDPDAHLPPHALPGAALPGLGDKRRPGGG